MKFSAVDKAMAKHDGGAARQRRAYKRFRCLPLDQIRGLPQADTETIGVGVYFLWDGPELVYVGKSSNVGDRISQHQRGQSGRKEFTHATLEAMPKECSRECEGDYVRKYLPFFNQTSSG